MSSFTSIREAFVQELKGVGLSSDQVFLLLMEREKTNQQEFLMEREKVELNRLSPDQVFQLLMKKEELKILEFEENSKKKKKRKHDKSSPSSKCYKPSSKKVCNEFPNRKSFQDLCNDELVTIFDFIPDFGVFKLAILSKQFHQIVLNNTKNVHLITKLKKDIMIERFINVGCFQNIESLTIDFDISLDLFTTILKNSDNLRVLKISIANDHNNHCLRFSDYPHSSFKKLETLHIKCFNERLTVKLNHGNLHNLTDLKIEGIKCNVSDFLNVRVNNIKKLHLNRVNCDSKIPTMKMLTHLTLDDCDISDVSLCSLLVDTLEHVRIENCEHDDDEDNKDELELPSEFPFLKTLSVSGSEELIYTTLLKSKLPSLTDLTLDRLIKSIANALSENTSITSLKKLSINYSVEQGAPKILMESQRLLNEIESIDIDVLQYDSNTLVYISKNASKMSNLKELKIVGISSGLNGYKSFFTSSHFANLESLTLSFPTRMENLNYLAQTTYFTNLKVLHIIDTTGETGTKDKPPENFFSLFSSSTTFNQLRELGLSFLDDSSITHIKSMKNLKTIYVNREKVTGWGLKQLDEWGLKWLFIGD